MRVQLVGIDCATVDKKVGLAFAVYTEGRIRIEDVLLWEKDQESVAARIATWVGSGAGPTLLAIDAPLGWPVPMADAIADHHAGGELTCSPNDMFRRTTDAFIQEKLGQKPLEVGADRIARTAHAALRLLGELRRDLGAAIPLAWGKDLVEEISAIEVYPAATLVAHGFLSSGYKKPAQIAQRQQIIDALAGVITLPDDSSSLLSNADALDAVVCILAAIDFLGGYALPPTDRELAEREGWIWVRSHIR
jgi:predicted RNase H-like nuclease